MLPSRVQRYPTSTRDPREMERRVSEVANIWERMGQRGAKEAHIRGEKFTSLIMRGGAIPYTATACPDDSHWAVLGATYVRAPRSRNALSTKTPSASLSPPAPTLSATPIWQRRPSLLSRAAHSVACRTHHVLFSASPRRGYAFL